MTRHLAPRLALARTRSRVLFRHRVAVLLVTGTVLSASPLARAPLADAQHATDLVAPEPGLLAVTRGPEGIDRRDPLRIDRRDEPRSHRMRSRLGRRNQRREAQSNDFRVEGLSGATFDRASGLTVWGGFRGRGARDYVPEVFLRTGYSWARKTSNYDGSVLQPVLPGRHLMVGARAWRTAASHDFDDRIVGDAENSLAAVFFKEDYRDWYKDAGQALLAESRLSGGSTFKASARREEVESLPVATTWSLFHRHRPFRPNPAVKEGSLRAWQGEYTLDLREGSDTGEPGRGFVLDVIGERAGQWGLNGDYHYDRLTAEVRGYLRLGPEIALDVRVMTGRLDVSPGLYPDQKSFYVGGLGTLPGYPHKAFRGDRMYLINTEYRLGSGPRFLVIADAGDAWMHGTRSSDLESDAGAGFEVGDEGEELRVMVARRLDQPDADPIWRLRLTRTF